MNDSFIPQGMSDAELDLTRYCPACEMEYTIRGEYEQIDGMLEPQRCADEYEAMCHEFCHWCFESGRWEDAYGQFDRYTLQERRKCKSCGGVYRIGDSWPSQKNYFPPPYSYEGGCYDHCIGCWIVGPESSSADHDVAFEDGIIWDGALTLAPESVDGWPYEDVYDAIFEGDLKTVYQWYFDRGNLLAVMPCSRLQVSRIRTFPKGFLFFPAGFLDLQQLRIRVNSESSNILSEAQSAASLINEQVFNRYPLVTFPVQGLTWEQFRSASHQEHLVMIRNLSEEVDRDCLDYARFKTCDLNDCEGLPCRVGQVAATNMMMAGMALYSSRQDQGQMVAGAAFTHYVTQGLGMTLDQYEWDNLPGQGETGQIARRGLRMYAELLEASTLTSKFVQAMSLFEFLAYPDQYEKMENVKKVISRYLAPVQSPEYARLLNRFWELTGREEKSVDQATGKPVRKHLGFRTRIVHLGERLEQIVPSAKDRSELFTELQSYLTPVLRHMIKHADLTFEDYKNVREGGFSESHVIAEHTEDEFDVPF